MTKPPERAEPSPELIRRLLEARSGVPGGPSAYGAYLDAHPEEGRVADELESLWDDLGRLPAPALRLPPAPAKLSVVERAKRSARWVVPMAMAAGIAGVAFLSPLSMRQEEPGVTAQRVVADATLRKLALNDGSTVTLAPHSALSIRMTAGQRSLTLEHGEAYFAVAHDKSRPFVVTTAEGETTAVGTAFDVRIDGPGAVVTVTEGTVRVAAPQGGETRYVTHGQQIRYRASGGRTALGEVAAAKSADATAWTTGFLRFEGVPLADVVSQVNAHSARRLVLTDAKLARMPIYANLKLGEVGGLLAIVAAQAKLGPTALQDRLRVESGD